MPEPDLQPAPDKHGAELNAQRFAMLEDIAKELAGEVVFPVDFNATLRLRQSLQNPDLPTGKIAAMVETEPLVAARLLKLANSVLYRRDDTPVRNLGTAVTRLGLKVVKSTALAIAMSQLLRAKELAAFSELANRLWQHSLRSAVAARQLVKSEPGCALDPEEAFLAGLVHDLGASYMLYRAARYPELRERPDTARYLILQWHESIGVALLNALGLPEEVVNAAADHDQPRTESPKTLRTLGDAVYLANLLAGAHFEWTGLERQVDTTDLLEARYAPLRAAINAETLALLAALN